MMRIHFHENVLNNREHFRHLDRILTRITDGAHDWQIDDVDAIASSEWYKEMKLYERDLFEKAAREASYPYAGLFCRQLQVCNDVQNKNQLGPVEAAHFVQQPLTILMENTNTDGALLCIAMEFLARPELWQLHQNPQLGLIAIAGVGGIGEIPKTIDAKIDEANNAGIPPRILVFTDSDGLFPGDIHKNAEKVKEKCEQVGIPCCILQKRAIENYIPNAVFQAHVSHVENIIQKPRIDILLAMTAEQRDYFSIKTGFGQHKPILHDGNLFNSMTEDERQTWSTGLSDRVIYWLEQYKSALTAEALNERDHQGDLTQIINMILDQL